MTPAKSPIDAAKKGIQYMSAVQTEDGTKNSTIHYTHTFLGHWAGDYGGPMFLMPGMVYYSNICLNPFRAHYHLLRDWSRAQTRAKEGDDPLFDH